jgi:hypothetical protein
MQHAILFWYVGFLSFSYGLQHKSIRMSLLTPHAVPTSKAFRSILPETVWRRAAADYQDQIYTLLQPGLTPEDHPSNSGVFAKRRTRQNISRRWMSLDPQNPVYNFLIQYYGIRGCKGVRRLSRWSPGNSVFLENAKHDDLSELLPLRGAHIEENGIGYQASFDDSERSCSTFLWHRTLLHNTLHADPVLYCHNLHEWAMQYQPNPDDAPPPAASYQYHLPLRVDRATIKQVVESKGVKCSHLDAIRHFAPAAIPLNVHHPTQRHDQLRLEQPACVHVHMDLLKMALKLAPFLPGTLLVRCLDVALQARKLDVAASPYDATSYGIVPVLIETESGRAEYRQRQVWLMEQAQVVRRELLGAYDEFLESEFSSEHLLHRKPSTFFMTVRS